MDWSNVGLSELFSALREGGVPSPRSLAEFFAWTKFSLPKTQRKCQNRIKCNIWYYRTNYLMILFCAVLIWFARSPASLTAVLVFSCGAMLGNDTVARNVNDRLVELLRNIAPQLARKLQASAHTSIGLGAPGGRSTRKEEVSILGVSRNYSATAIAAFGLFLLWRTQALLLLCWVSCIGDSLVLLHATMRAPNLKARLSTAREEFRAVWRGHQHDVVDYTL